VTGISGLPPAKLAAARAVRGGRSAPAATGISVRPATSSSRSALGSVSSSGTLPATGVRASTFSSGEFSARKMASASSVPGSVSIMTRRGDGAAPAPEKGNDAGAAASAVDSMKSRRVIKIAGVGAIREPHKKGHGFLSVRPSQAARAAKQATVKKTPSRAWGEEINAGFCRTYKRMRSRSRSRTNELPM